VYKIVFSEGFDQQFRKLVKNDRRYQIKVRKIVEIIKQDIDYPSLRLHKLSGTKFHSISVGMSIRIIALIEKDIIFFLKIGKHEDVY